jgi:hypothetical protein
MDQILNKKHFNLKQVRNSVFYFIQYISVHNATYYCPLSFSQHVSAVHGHHQVSLLR